MRLSLKYGQLFANQSNDSKHVTEANNGTSESKTEQQNNQSQPNRTFQIKSGVNKKTEGRKTHPGSPILARQNQVAN